MLILQNKPAIIELKEKTIVREEFGQFLPCIILEIEPVWIEKDIREFFGRSNLQVLVVENSYGERFRIPLEDVEGVRYK